MNTKSLVVIVVAIVGILAAIFLLRFIAPTPSPLSSDRLTVAATIFPLADIIKHIGGDTIDVITIIEPGISEHDTTLKPQLLAAVGSAKAFFMIGHNLDNHIANKISNVYPQVPVIPVDKNITLREFTAEHEEDEEESEHGDEDQGVDPHYWLSVPNAQHIARTVADELIKLDAEHAAVYEQNFTTYNEQLQILEKTLQTRSAQIQNKHFIAMHNAWGYFAEQYNLELVATYEPIEGKQPTIQDLQHLREIINEYGIKTFYAEPQKASSSATRFLSTDFGLDINVLDPVGGIDGRDSYEKMLLFNMENLVAGQKIAP